MTPEERIVRRLVGAIEQELQSLAVLGAEAAEVPRDSSTVTLRARGSILHDFYGGVERVFLRIADEVDGDPPKGEHWHRRLANDLTLEIPGVRPAVITADLRNRLEDYLAFRHLFRNVYGFVLDDDRLAPLEARLSEIHRAFDEQLRAFLRWLEGSG